MNNKSIFISICIFCLFLCSCGSKNHYFLMTENSKNPGSIEVDNELEKSIEINNAVIFLDFDTRYQKNNQGVGFKIFSREKFEKLIIDDLTIKFSDHSERLYINKTYQNKMLRKTIHSSYDIDKVFFYAWESFMDSEVLIDFDKLFKTMETKCNSSFPISIVVNYKLDDVDFSQELHFIVFVAEKRKFAPAFIYKYFNGF